MWQSLLNSSTISLLEKTAVFGERRQDVLAGNIANIDTPNYKMRDLPVAEFQEALQQAVASKSVSQPSRASRSLSGTGSADLNELFPNELFQATEATPRNLTFQDANNRSIEYQVMEMTKNSIMQSFAVELLTTQFHLMETIISERV